LDSWHDLSYPWYVTRSIRGRSTRFCAMNSTTPWPHVGHGHRAPGGRHPGCPASQGTPTRLAVLSADYIGVT